MVNFVPEATVLTSKLHAVTAKYDELIEEGTISMASFGSCNGDQHFCVGLNVNADCTVAAKPIP